jgi:hypothetical protein
MTRQRLYKIQDAITCGFMRQSEFDRRWKRRGQRGKHLADRAILLVTTAVAWLLGDGLPRVLMVALARYRHTAGLSVPMRRGMMQAVNAADTIQDDE